MSNTVIPRTFPYRPSGGWHDEDIWGGPAPNAPAVSGNPMSGRTKETLDRLAQVIVSGVEKATDAYVSRIAPAREVETRPGEGHVGAVGTTGSTYIGAVEGYEYDPATGAYIPKLRIEAAASKAPFYVGAAILGALLLVGIFKAGRA